MGVVFKLIYTAWDLAVVMLKIAVGMDPDLIAYWRRRGYNDQVAEFLMRRV